MLSEALPKLAFLLTDDDALVFDEDSVAKLKAGADDIQHAAVEVLKGLDDFSADAIKLPCAPDCATRWASSPA